MKKLFFGRCNNLKKNIAILIPQLAGGGAERVASNLSMYLSEDKYQKYIIVHDAEKADYPYRGKLINLETKAIKNPLGKIKNFIMRINKLKTLKKEYNIHTTISLLSGPNLLNILTKKDDKVIVSVRNFVSKSSNGLYGKLFKLSIKVLYNKADAIVAVSQSIKNNLIKNFGLDENKIKIIYNPYDIEKINKLVKEEIEEEYKEVFKNPTIITAGRLSRQKGQWHLIRAFKKIKEIIPDAKLVVLGQGELEAYLKQLTVDLELEDDVYFLGFQKNPFKYIAKSTVYVFPSLYEGFPNALCEAMTCGIPVISADCKSGPREILAPNTDIYIETGEIEYVEYGILVPTCDGIMYKFDDELTNQEQILCKCITGIMKNKDDLKKYSQRSTDRIKAFNMKKIIKVWEDEI